MTTQYEQFSSKVQSLRFWESPSVLKIQKRDLTADGARLIFEGVEARNSHFVYRGSATIEKSPFQGLGKFLLSQVGFLPRNFQ
jgi:hypothetical protein